ncbi:hypothetical protein [Kitasatospora aureofaciens]|uniref:hypothetical protein n=1 Tax=Kitasatospora aureofaciens TaxID=1894 RepID=UPI0037C93B11
MNDIAQGGAGGVPLHHGSEEDGSTDPRAPGVTGRDDDGSGGSGGSGTTGGSGASGQAPEDPVEDQGDATTAQPGRARRLGSDESGETESAESESGETESGETEVSDDA